MSQDISLKNQLVAALPPLERGLLLEYSEVVELQLYAVLVRAGDFSEFAYFPLDCMVSNVLGTAHTPDMEVSLVGMEGMVNTSMVLGLATAPFTSLVQSVGYALKIHRNALQLRRAEDALLRNVLLRYTGVVSCQMAQRTLCMNYHTVLERLARSLLMARDRSHSLELFITHEAFAVMLGVRRESVSLAARHFQARGLISYRRGYVILLDSVALERAACNCYFADCATYDQMWQTDAERIASNSSSLTTEPKSALSGRADFPQEPTVLDY